MDHNLWSILYHCDTVSPHYGINQNDFGIIPNAWNAISTFFLTATQKVISNLSFQVHWAEVWLESSLKWKWPVTSHLSLFYY